ncbi:hypothetical protein BsWGS_13343 [Bradybaena similaris]
MMMNVVNQQGFSAASMFQKNTFFGVLLFLVAMPATLADDDLDIEECSSRFTQTLPTAMCVSMTRDYWKLRTEICSRNDFIQIQGFRLHIPAKNAQTFCDTSIVSTKFHYNSTIDISCLMKFGKKGAKKLLETIMEAFSGKAASEVDTSHVMDEFISNKLFGLPDFSLLDLNYTCFNKEDGIIPYVDMCDAVNVTDDTQLHVIFNVTSYSQFTAFPGCSCVITSARNLNVTVRAIDVRLVGQAQLRLSAAHTVALDSSQLYWWQDGVLISLPGELLLDLTIVNPSELPHSIWLQVTGHELSIRCGNSTWQTLDSAPVHIQNPIWYMAFVGISAGMLVFLILLATFLWRFCRRSQVKQKYSVVCPKASHEATSSRVPSKSVENEDESMYKSLASNIYFEVEPNYAETHLSCSTTNNVQTVVNTETCPDDHRRSSSCKQDNVYSHLKETADASAITDLYDTILGHEYSTLQRTVAETLIDNVYNT